MLGISFFAGTKPPDCCTISFTSSLASALACTGSIAACSRQVQCSRNAGAAGCNTLGLGGIALGVISTQRTSPQPAGRMPAKTYPEVAAELLDDLGRGAFAYPKTVPSAPLA